MELKKGTTTIGVACPDGVILGADMRATLGHLAMNRDTKVAKITDFIGVASAGTVADIQILQKWLKSQLDLYKLNTEMEPTVDVAVNLLSSVLFSGAKGFFPHMVMLMLGGKSNEGDWKLFSLDPAGSALADKFIAHGTGMELAYGVLEEGYKDGMKVEQAKELVSKALVSAVRRDIGSGDGLEVFVIDEKGFRRVKFIKYKDALRD